MLRGGLVSWLILTYCAHIEGGILTLYSDNLGDLAWWLRTRIVHTCCLGVGCTEGAGCEAEILLILFADEWLVEVVVGLLSTGGCCALLLIGLAHI